VCSSWGIHCISHLRLLDDKRKEIGVAASKLRNGLDKLIDTRQKVEAMTVELEETKTQLAVFQKQCEEYLVVIVQQKRDAEEQEKSVAARSEKIAVEEARCQVRIRLVGPTILGLCGENRPFSGQSCI
jgi:chromosome segregation ATPase